MMDDDEWTTDFTDHRAVPELHTGCLIIYEINLFINEPTIILFRRNLDNYFQT